MSTKIIIKYYSFTLSKVLLTRFLVFSIVKDLVTDVFLYLCYREMRLAGSDGDGGLNVLTTLAAPAAIVVIVVKKSSSELEEINKEICVNSRGSSTFTVSEGG